MKVRFAAGLSRSGNHLMTTEVVTGSLGYPRTDEAAAKSLSQFVWQVAIVEIELPDPPPVPEIILVDAQIMKVSEQV